MSWLQKAALFLKNGQKSEDLSLSQIQEWLQQRSQEIVEQKQLLTATREHAILLEEKRAILQTKLELWQKKIRLHPKANEFILLFRETRQLLDKLHFSKQPAMGEVIMINQELEKRIRGLMEKAEALDLEEINVLLREKGEDNENVLLAALLDLDAVRKRLDTKISESKYHTVLLICSKAEHLQRIANHKQQLHQELDSKKGRLLSARQKRSEKEKSLQQLQGDKKTLDLEELTKRKKELEHLCEEREMEVLSFFSKIKPLLQHYKEFEPSNGLLFSYINDPLSSFFQDEGLFVEDILEKIAEMLRQGKIPLNQEAMLSSLSALEGIYNHRLSAIKEEYKSHQKELKELSVQTQRNFFIIKVDDAAYRLEHYVKQAAKMEEEITLLQQKVSKLELVMARGKEELQSLIKSSLQRTVVVLL